MKTKLFAAAICALALSACDFEKQPDSAPDQGGSGVTRPGGAGTSPMTPPGGGASRSTPPAGGGSSSGGSSTQ